MDRRGIGGAEGGQWSGGELGSEWEQAVSHAFVIMSGYILVLHITRKNDLKTKRNQTDQLGSHRVIT